MSTVRTWANEYLPSRMEAVVEYRRLGQSGMRVSPLCIGTMLFGHRTDRATSRRIVDHAFDRGVNFIDTANVYAEGCSEEIVGEAVSRNRLHWLLASKVGHKTGSDPNSGGLSRGQVMRACDESLSRLKTDYIDCYYLHKEDPDTPIEETLSVLGDLIRSGKIRYFGVSNYRAWRIAEISHLCKAMNIPPPIASQPYYNAFNRMPETEHFSACRRFGLAVVPYSPLARGILSGKYRLDKEPDKDTRAGDNDRRMRETEWRAESLELAQAIRAYCEKKGWSIVQFAIAWVLNSDVIPSAIVGPRTFEQWETYLTALDIRITEEDEAFIDSLVAPGHPSTPGYNDPAYPIEGRHPLVH